MIISKNPIMKYLLNFPRETSIDKMQLPVPPSAYEIKVAHNNNVVQVADIGDMNFVGTSGLMTITLEGFFPAQHYYFCQCAPLAPYLYVRQILEWKESGKPLRLMVTGTKVNHSFAIESFDYAEKDGTGDVYFSLGLKEYRYMDGASKNAIDEDTGLNGRPDEKQKPESICVMPGDDLMDVARRATGGDGDQIKYAMALVKSGGVKPGDVLQAVKKK